MEKEELKNEEVMSESGEKKEKKPAKINEAKLEVIIAIFLALTALLTSWAAWIGSLHGGNQATNYAKSNNIAADGNSRYNEASQLMMQDMLLWNEISDLQLEFMFAQDNRDADTEALVAYKLYYKCMDNLTDDMAAMLDWDFEAAADCDDPVDYIEEWIQSENAVVSPFGDEEFANGYYADAMDVLAESEAVLVEGQQDNVHGDSFNLATVIYSLVLFLLGIAGTFKNLPNRKFIVLISIICFAIATVYMFTLPMPTGFSFASFFKG